jgi:hypothetical protein
VIKEITLASSSWQQWYLGTQYCLQALWCNTIQLVGISLIAAGTADQG